MERLWMLLEQLSYGDSYVPMNMNMNIACAQLYVGV